MEKFNKDRNYKYYVITKVLKKDVLYCIIRMIEKLFLEEADTLVRMFYGAFWGERYNYSFVYTPPTKISESILKNEENKFGILGQNDLFIYDKFENEYFFSCESYFKIRFNEADDKIKYIYKYLEENNYLAWGL